jgi:hypothetical protein
MDCIPVFVTTVKQSIQMIIYCIGSISGWSKEKKVLAMDLKIIYLWEIKIVVHLKQRKKSVIVARNRKLDDLIRRPKNITRVSAWLDRSTIAKIYFSISAAAGV